MGRKSHRRKLTSNVLDTTSNVAHRHSFSMNNVLYPHDWRLIALAIKEACGWCCQNPNCQKQCRRPGEMWLGWDYELTVSHYDQEYDAPEVFVVAWCAECHFRHDAPFVWRSRRRARRLRQLRAGQLALFI
jgi:hypothetical protein